MRIGITDSGVGGLSVCAELETRLREEPIAEDIELVYLNAALRDDYAYNAMASREQKLETFDRFLENVTALYRPDLLYIACNSLSVLFQDPYFEHHRRFPINGIVETGTAAILSALQEDEESAVIIFATPTTVEEGTYPRNLVRAGIAPERIVQQARRLRFYKASCRKPWPSSTPRQTP
jgi:glutamate racemase